MQELIDQYTGVDEDSRLTRQFITQIEFDTTMHVLAEYLTPKAKVIEQGAATGKYALTFAKMGCDTTAVELAPEQVNILTRNAADQGLTLAIHEGNACSVPFIDSNSHDLCVILGPLYHLQTQEERDQAIEEAYRILKPDGVLAVAYISRYFVAGMFAQHFPELVTPDVLSTLLETGLVPNPLADSFFNVGYFAMPAEIEHLVTEHGFSTLRHVATDGFNRYIASGVNSFTPSQYQTWLRYHLKTCDDPSLLGSSNHGLVIARKTC
ncbi:class I SAM-dependent methyltransferase [Moritella sp. 24]|uniref:class I SAM-dependent methyltransferase n=1 Tax=Moritella sp. 24 TaxID=2746230 RepID=UPI001BA5E48E|nr:class I SAM-dependent methyltransferase [Moritella sp. 24]QUM76926.1 class I SAM-dependent methyltransferase [Moritella sp. 24]